MIFTEKKTKEPGELLNMLDRPKELYTAYCDLWMEKEQLRRRLAHVETERFKNGTRS